MADQDLNIILRLIDGITGPLGKATASIDKFANSMKKAGSDIQKVGQNMTFLGTAIMAPLALAFNTASKYSTDLSHELERTKTIVTDLQISIGQALLPVVEKMNNVIANLVRTWKSLPEGTREAIVQFVAIAGILLVLDGVVFSVIGRVLKLVAAVLGFIAINPYLILIAGAFLAISLAIGDVNKALNGVEILAYMVAIGFLKMSSWISEGLEKLATAFARLMNIIAQSGAFEETMSAKFANAGRAAVGFAKDMQTSQEVISGWITTLEGKIASILETGEGGLVDLKDKLKELYDMLTNPPDISMNMTKYIQDMKAVFKEYIKSVKEDLGTTFGNTIIETWKSMTQAFGNSVAQMIVYGKDFGQTMKEAFKQILADFIAKITAMITEWIIMSTIGEWIMAGIMATSATMAAVIAAAWAPAAAMVNAATFGAGAVAGASSLAMITGLAQALAAIKIPAMAEGGIIRQPTLALIGERGPEVVIPLGNKEYARGNTTYINIEINNPSVRDDHDIDALTEQISERLIREAERRR